MSTPACAFWIVQPGFGELRSELVPDPGPDEVLVRACFSAVSRGTERLVFNGQVPPDQAATMRAPFQQGDFPAPVKYGYLSVGVVEQGVEALVGEPVFCLHPHQSAYVVPVAAVTRVPPEVPLRRAVLAGTVETALNALWDGLPLLGDRVTVVGGGMVGCCLARLLAGVPGITATLVDVDPGRAAVADALGVRFRTPDSAHGEQDLVFHTSATGTGLQQALGLLGTGGTVVELSWYGTTEVSLALGGAFHSRRLAVRSSQVGRVSPAARPRWTPESRRTLALDLLRDPAFDHLLTGESRLEDLPDLMTAVGAGTTDGLCHTISYGDP